MTTITSYYTCIHCGCIVSIIHSSELEPTNLLLCPKCGRNIFG